MSGLNFEIVHTAVSYWLGALSEPVLIISRDEMKQAAAQGAVIWDVRSAQEFQQGHAEGALSLGSVDWLLADNCGGNLIPATVIEDQLRQAGIHVGRPVIIYAEQRAVDAFVALRALRSIGITDGQVCLGDGAAREAGITDAGRPRSAAHSTRRDAVTHPA
jgi:3-mercaptopyruvate sulfurtransferase SseA